MADVIGWALIQAGIQFLIHYSDDFLFFVSPSRPGLLVLSRVLNILENLRVPVAVPKIEGPATVVAFLGILVDTSQFELRLPGPKLEFIRELLRTWCGRHSRKCSDFESLLGHLSHAATVICQGRIFLRHLFTILTSTRSWHHYVHLDGTASADLLWWDYFLTGMVQCSSPSLLILQFMFSQMHLGHLAVVVLWNSHWFQLEWPPSWTSMDIAVKELVPVVVVSAIWGKSWHHKHVCFHTNNMAIVAILQNWSAKNRVAHYLLRCFYFYTAYFQFNYSVAHIPGVLNVAVDALSRDNITLFSSLVPQATPSQVSLTLFQLLIIQQPDWGFTHLITMFVNNLSTL